MRCQAFSPKEDWPMSAAVAQCPPRFVRRTMLAENEYRVNFKQIDNDVIKALVSPEAREVTQRMSTIYLSLLLAPQARCCASLLGPRSRSSLRRRSARWQELHGLGADARDHRSRQFHTRKSARMDAPKRHHRLRRARQWHRDPHLFQPRLFIDSIQ